MTTAAEISLISGRKRITTNAIASSPALCARNGRITYIGYATHISYATRQVSKTKSDCPRDAPRWVRHHSLSNCRAASFVPATRTRIFSKAMSRDVEVSSAKGEKPQSSVLPSWLAGK